MPVLSKMLRDILSVLYEPDGCMSLPRLVFFLNFFLFGAAVIVPEIPQDKASLAMTSLGITGASFIGNKAIGHRKPPEPHNEDGR